MEQLVKNILKVLEKENGNRIKTAIQSEAGFQAEKYRNVFYKKYNKHDKGQKIANIYRKVPTV